MSDADADMERQLRIELMAVQIDKGRLDIERVRQEMRYEPWKMLALGFGAGAGLVAAIVGLLTAILK